MRNMNRLGDMNRIADERFIGVVPKTDWVAVQNCIFDAVEKQVVLWDHIIKQPTRLVKIVGVQRALTKLDVQQQMFSTEFGNLTFDFVFENRNLYLDTE